MINQNLPSVPDRVKAVICDAVVIILIMIAITFTFDRFEHVPDSARLIALIFVFGLYDPLFTSLFGGTIGHMAMGLRVKRSSNHDKNILLPLAIIRFIFKSMLGWVSLPTVTGHDQKKAIHDLASGSIVIYKK